MVAVSPNAARIEAFLALAASSNPSEANAIFDDIEIESLTPPERAEWHHAITLFCQNQEHEELPDQIVSGALEAVGVKVLNVGNTDDEDYDLRILGDGLRMIEGIDALQLIELSDLPFEGAKEFDNWEIYAHLDVLFIDKEEQQAQTVGYLAIDWQPGVTKFNRETGELQGLRAALAPFGADELTSRSVSARVSGGKLEDVRIGELSW